MPLVPNALLQVEQLETGDKFAQAKALTNTNLSPINEQFRSGFIIEAETDVWVDPVVGFPAQLGLYSGGSAPAEPLPAGVTFAQIWPGTGTGPTTKAPNDFFASVTFQDLHYQAVAGGSGGDLITVTYTTVGGGSGPATVSVTGQAITVVLSTTTANNTASLINTLINTTSASASLVRSSVSGTPSNPQVAGTTTLGSASSYTFVSFGDLVATAGEGPFQLYTIPNSGVDPNTGNPITSPGQEQSFIVVSQQPISDAFQDIQAVHLQNIIPPSFNDSTLGPLAGAAKSNVAVFGIPNGYRMVLVPALTGGASPTPDLTRVITDAIPLINGLIDPQKTGSRLTVDYRGGIVRLSIPPPASGSASPTTTEINPNNVFDANGRVILFASFYQFTGRTGGGVYQNLGGGNFADITYGPIANNTATGTGVDGWIMTFGPNAEVYVDNGSDIYGTANQLGFELGAMTAGGATDLGQFAFVSSLSPSPLQFQTPPSATLTNQDFYHWYSNNTGNSFRLFMDATQAAFTLTGLSSGSYGSAITWSLTNPPSATNSNLIFSTYNGGTRGSSLSLAYGSAALGSGTVPTTPVGSLNAPGTVSVGTGLSTSLTTANTARVEATFFSTDGFTNFTEVMPSGGVISGTAGSRDLQAHDGSWWRTHNAKSTNYTVVTSESHGTTTSGVTTYNFTLTSLPVVPRTLSITVSGGLATAVEIGNGVLQGGGVAAGSSINYVTGAVTLILNASPSGGQTITAAYDYGYQWSADDASGAGSAIALVVDAEGLIEPTAGTYSYIQGTSNIGSAWPQFNLFHPFALTTTISTTTTLPTANLPVADGSLFPSGGGIVTFYSSAGLQTFTYTSLNPTTLIGASQGAGTVNAGALVTMFRQAITTQPVVFPSTTITVDSTAGFPSSGVLNFYIGTALLKSFTYTSTTATTFVGTSQGSGTLPAGNLISFNPGGWQFKTTIADDVGNMSAAGTIAAGNALVYNASQANTARFSASYYTGWSQNYTHLLTAIPDQGVNPSQGTARVIVGSDGSIWFSHNANSTNPTVVVNESHGTTTSGTTTYTGTFSNTPVNPYSVSIVVNGTLTATDSQYGNGNLFGSGFTTGTIDYATGAYSFTLTSNPGTGETINASYTYGYPWAADDEGNPTAAFVVEAETSSANQPQGAYLYWQGVTTTSWPQSATKEHLTTASLGTWTTAPQTFTTSLTTPVVPGTVQVYDGVTLVVTDQGNGVFSGTYAGATVLGTINYATGALSITLTGGTPNSGSITVQYYQAIGWSQRTTLMDKNGNMVVSGNTLTIGGNPVNNYLDSYLGFTTLISGSPQTGTLSQDANGNFNFMDYTQSIVWSFDVANGNLYLPGGIDLQSSSAGGTFNIGTVEAGTIQVGQTTSANLTTVNIVAPSGGSNAVNLNAQNINIGTGTATSTIFLGHSSTNTKVTGHFDDNNAAAGFAVGVDYTAISHTTTDISGTFTVQTTGATLPSGAASSSGLLGTVTFAVAYTNTPTVIISVGTGTGTLFSTTNVPWQLQVQPSPANFQVYLTQSSGASQNPTTAENVQVYYYVIGYQD